MKNILLTAGLFVLGVWALSAQTPLGEGPQTLVDAEQSFAAMSVAEGMKKAFLTFLADEAIVFRPGPVNGKSVWKDRKETTARLEWHPTFAFVAASGELGYTSGPWTYTPDLDQPPQYGYFVSIWKKQNDGQWKVVLDLGVTTGFSSVDTELVISSLSESTIKLYADAEKNSILDTEKKVSLLSNSSGLGVAFDKYLSDDARVYRDGILPLVGREEIIAHFADGPKKFTSSVMSCTLANSCDLAYTYGEYSSTHNSVAESGYFLRIWRKVDEWKLVNEVLSPALEENQHSVHKQ